MIASFGSDHPDLSMSLKRIIHRFFEAWDPPPVLAGPESPAVKGVSHSESRYDPPYRLGPADAARRDDSAGNNCRHKDMTRL